MKAGCATCGHRFNARVRLSQLCRVKCPKCKKRTTTTAEQVPTEEEIAERCAEIVRRVEEEFWQPPTPCKTIRPDKIAYDFQHCDNPYWGTEFE